MIYCESVAKLKSAESTRAASLSLVTEDRASSTSAFVIVLGSLDLILARVLSGSFIFPSLSTTDWNIIPLCLFPSSSLNYCSGVP